MNKAKKTQDFKCLEDTFLAEWITAYDSSFSANCDYSSVRLQRICTKRNVATQSMEFCQP